MPLHTERTIVQPLRFFASEEAMQQLTYIWQKIFVRNAIQGNASVTVVEDDMNEVCLFPFRGFLCGILVSYDTQVLAVMTQRETLKYFNDRRIEYQLLKEQTT